MAAKLQNVKNQSFDFEFDYENSHHQNGARTNTNTNTNSAGQSLSERRQQARSQSHCQTRQVYTLVRGERETFEGEFLLNLQRLEELGKIARIRRIIQDTLVTQNFGGILYTVRFKTDKPIFLTGLGFFGPGNKRRGKFKVQIIITEYAKSYPTSSPNDLARANLRTEIMAEPAEIFDIPLSPSPIYLKANKWISVQFQLDGPETYMCGDVGYSYHCRDSNVHFDFHNSSRQLPKIYYTLS